MPTQSRLDALTSWPECLGLSGGYIPGVVLDAAAYETGWPQPSHPTHCPSSDCMHSNSPSYQLVSAGKDTRPSKHSKPHGSYSKHCNKLTFWPLYESLLSLVSMTCSCETGTFNVLDKTTSEPSVLRTRPWALVTHTVKLHQSGGRHSGQHPISPLYSNK